MRNFFIGVFVAFLGIFGIVYVFFAGGFAPVATAAPPLPFEKLMASLALKARVSKEAPKEAPFQPTAATYADGATTYLTHCALCHGLPGHPRTPIAAGEFPRPPALLEGRGVADDPVGVTYWKIANGIRMTGMPSFDHSLSARQTWSVAWMLKDADELPPEVKGRLQQGTAQAPAVGGSGSTGQGR